MKHILLLKRPGLLKKFPMPADIEVIAFIQNNITKEIYQADSNLKHNIVVGIDNLYDKEGKDFALYPNPAVNKLTISFDKILKQRQI